MEIIMFAFILFPLAAALFCYLLFSKAVTLCEIRIEKLEEICI